MGAGVSLYLHIMVPVVMVGQATEAVRSKSASLTIIIDHAFLRKNWWILFLLIKKNGNSCEWERYMEYQSGGSVV